MRYTSSASSPILSGPAFSNYGTRDNPIVLDIGPPSLADELKDAIDQFGTISYENYCVSLKTRVVTGRRVDDTEAIVWIGTLKHCFVHKSRNGWVLPDDVPLHEWLQPAGPTCLEELGSSAYQSWFFSNGRIFDLFGLPPELRLWVIGHLIGGEVRPMARPKVPCPHLPCDSDDFIMPNSHDSIMPDIHGALTSGRAMRVEMMTYIRNFTVHKYHHINTLHTMTIPSLISIDQVRFLDLSLTTEEFELLDSVKPRHRFGRCPAHPRSRAVANRLSGLCWCPKEQTVNDIRNRLACGRLHELTLTVPHKHSIVHTKAWQDDMVEGGFEYLDDVEESLGHLNSLGAQFLGLMESIPASKYRIKGWTHAQSAAEYMDKWTEMGLGVKITFE